MEETEVECPTCKRPSDDSFMICCDSCDSWYHGQCVGQFKNRKKQMWNGPCCCNRWMGLWVKQSKRSAPSLKDPPSACSPSIKDAVAKSTSPFKVSSLNAEKGAVTRAPATFHLDPPLPLNFTQLKCTSNESAIEDDSTHDSTKRTPIKDIDSSPSAIPIRMSPAGMVPIEADTVVKSTTKVSYQTVEKGVTRALAINSDSPPSNFIQLNCTSNESALSEDTRDSIKRMLFVDTVHSQPKSTNKRSLSLKSSPHLSKTAKNDHNSEKPSPNLTTSLLNVSSMSSRKGMPSNVNPGRKQQLLTLSPKRSRKSENCGSLDFDKPYAPGLNRTLIKDRISSPGSNLPIKSSAKMVSFEAVAVAKSTSPFKVSSLNAVKGAVTRAPATFHLDPPPLLNFTQLKCTFNESAIEDDSTHDSTKRMLFVDKVHSQPKSTNKRSLSLKSAPHLSKTAKNDHNSEKPSHTFATSLWNVSSCSGKGTPSTVNNISKVNLAKKQEPLTLTPNLKKNRKSEDSDSSDLDENIFQPKKNKSVKQRFTPDSQQSHPPFDCRSEDKEGPKTETKKSLSCQFCQKKMSCHQSLSRHKKACIQNINRKPSEHICTACGKNIPRRYVFIAHIKKCTGEKVIVNYGVGKMSCPYKNCQNNQFQFKVDLYEHLYTEHKADLKPPEIRIFDSYKEFDKWKTSVEDESFSYFSQQYGKRNGRSYFYCQHDGSEKSHLKNQQSNKTTRRNKKGRIKKSDLCLAMMSLKYLPDGKIKVAYRPTHLHPCRPRDLKHQPLLTATNEYISKQLAWNVPPRKIVQNLRDDSYKRANRLSRSSIKLKRDNLVKIKTITERMRKKNSSLRFSNDDAESVYFKVKTLMEEEYNPILIYKPKGEKTIIGPEGSEHLPEDVFLLAFQTKEQLDMMVEGCKEILAIDETHSTNPYDHYQLLNMMVRDKFNLGYPVGHAISSRSDEAVLQFVFKAIKERCPDLKINCCITDDDPALINSVNAGLGEAVWHLLCVWHIHRTIQSNIRHHVKENDLVSEIYSIMCVLIDEPDECQFLKLKDSFLLEYSHKCPTFKDYFENTFLPKAQKWAKCYRLKHHGETETTMLVESFHNILKTVYMKRVPNKRIDDLLDLLLTIEEDYFTRYTNAVLLNSMSDKDFSDLSKRHLKGMKINDLDVTQISGKCWTVRSQDKNSTEEYIVVRCADQCFSDSCIYSCCYCDTLCSHLFTCSCPDMFPLCKHLHKVFSIIAVSAEPDAKEEKEPEFFTAVENTETVDNETATQSLESHEERSFQRRIEAIRKIMQDLDNKFLDTSPVKRLLPRIENTFRDIQTQCKVLCEDPVIAVTEMDVKSKTAPNEKLKKQLKPFEKKSRKRKKKELQKPHRQSVKEIKDFLLHEQEDEENVDADLSDYLPQLSNEQTSDESIRDDTPLIDIVLEHQGIRISSLHLKALNPNINTTELPSLLRADPNFVHGYLYDEVINIYLKLLCDQNHNVFACDTTLALRLCSGKSDFKNFCTKLSHKSIILFPGNLDDKHWVIIAVEVTTCSMWYYNSLSSPESLLSQSERKFLSAVARLLRDVFPLIKTWSVKRHFDPQKDLVSCGVHICWFAYCIGINSVISPLEDCSQFRLSIYDSIISIYP